MFCSENPNNAEIGRAKDEVRFSDSRYEPMERATIEEDEEEAVVVNGRLLLSIKRNEGPVENQVVKARLGALGHVIFTQHGPQCARRQQRELWKHDCDRSLTSVWTGTVWRCCFALIQLAEGEVGHLSWCSRPSLQQRVHDDSRIPSCHGAVREHAVCFTTDQRFLGASTLGILARGGRGNDHVACSINQTILCRRAQARSERVQES